MSVTFNVFDVKTRQAKLETKSTKEVVQALTKIEPEAVSELENQIVPIKYNGFVETIEKAYNLHYPLVLNPDSTWLAITQGLAQHINANAEELRHQFVNFDGKEYIEIERHSFIKGNPNNNWEGCFPEFATRIKEFIGKKHDLIVADFSTTTPLAKAVSELVLMDSMKSYFDYRVRTRCGIPSVTLEGTIEDWESIYNRTQCFGEFGLTWWTDNLLPVLEEFVNAASGQPNVEFWKKIYHLEGGSGGPFITGWVNKFIPYRVCYDGSLRKHDHREMSHDQLPSTLSKVPFKWIYYNEVFQMEFVGGIVGIEQLENNALKPKLGWAIHEVQNSA